MAKRRRRKQKRKSPAAMTIDSQASKDSSTSPDLVEVSSPASIQEEEGVPVSSSAGVADNNNNESKESTSSNASKCLQTAESKSDNAVLSPTEIVRDLQQEEQESAYVGAAAVPVLDIDKTPVMAREIVTAASDVPVDETTSKPTLENVATSPSMAASGPRTSPVSALQELDDTVDEFSPPKCKKDVAVAVETNADIPAVSPSSNMSIPEEEAPVDMEILTTPYDEVSSSTQEKTKVAITLHEKQAEERTIRDEPDVANKFYEGSKGVWMWTKGHIPLANIWMGLAESVANSVLEVTTGSNVHKMDETVIKPQVNRFDSDLLNPAIHAVVDAILESKDSKGGQNPVQSMLFSILRPSFRFLLKVDEKATGETSVEG